MCRASVEQMSSKCRGNVEQWRANVEQKSGSEHVEQMSSKCRASLEHMSSKCRADVVRARTVCVARVLVFTTAATPASHTKSSPTRACTQHHHNYAELCCYHYHQSQHFYCYHSYFPLLLLLRSFTRCLVLRPPHADPDPLSASSRHPTFPAAALSHPISTPPLRARVSAGPTPCRVSRARASVASARSCMQCRCQGQWGLVLASVYLCAVRHAPAAVACTCAHAMHRGSA